MQTSNEAAENPCATASPMGKLPGTISLRCVSCGALADDRLAYRCAACGGVLEVVQPLSCDAWRSVEPASVGGSLWMYRARLPVSGVKPVTLGEGATPLLEAPDGLVPSDLCGRVLLKDETRNPTGSFKDRLITVAISRALADGYAGIVCASTGNAGAAAAAYAARAGVPCVVCVPASAPAGKLRQIQEYGAQFVAVYGTYSDAWALAAAIQDTGTFANVTTTYQNPFGVSALRTVAYELIDALGSEAPDVVFVPTGSGPLVRGVVWGYQEAVAMGTVDHVPAVVAVQAEGCAPIVRAFDAGADDVEPWGAPDTSAAGIADPLQGYAQDGSYTLAMVRASRGWAIAVSDDEIRSAAAGLSLQAGVFAELSGAAGLAGLRASLRRGLLESNATAVVLVTGSGFKDICLRQPAAARRIDFDPTTDDVAGLIERVRVGDPGDAGV